MKEYTTGNAKVDLMAQIQLTGNVTPQVWYKTITKENGRPHLLAIAILSDIVYWYRPAEIRDESTGHITGYKKRFKADMLQRSYDQFAELLGESKRSVTDAVVRLEALGVIKRVFRTIEIGGMRYNNVLFIDLFPEQLCRLTYPDNMEEPTPVTELRERGHENAPLSQNYGGGVTEKGDPCHRIMGEGSQKNVTHNTKNTTEIITENTSSSVDDDASCQMQECCSTAIEGGCTPEIVDAVAGELKRYGESLSPPAFLEICRNISRHVSSDIANMPAYIQKCIANMVLAKKLSEADAAHRIRAENEFLRRGYGMEDWDMFEQNILSN